MVEVAGANRMMAGLDMFCVAESGFGLKVGAFHCSSIQFPGQFDRLQAAMPIMDIVSSCEQESYMSFVACYAEYTADSNLLHSVKIFRRETSTFFRDLPKFVAGTKARFVKQTILTGSSGSLTLVLVYRE